MDLSRNNTDLRRPLDIHSTVLRLRGDVVEYVRKHKVSPTAEILGEALRDLSVLPPWDHAEPDRLGQDFLDTLEQLDPTTRRVVRLTLGLDHPEESLTGRRHRLRSEATGGSGHIQEESYALAKALCALITWKSGPSVSSQRERTLSGFVIREATVTVVLSEYGEHYGITLKTECQEDGARIALVPATGYFNRGAHFTVQRWHGDSREVESGKPLGEISVYPSPSSDHVVFKRRHCYYVVSLTPCNVGDCVQIDLAGPPRSWWKGPLFGAPIRANAIWWSSLGTEERVQLQMTAPREIINEVSAIHGDQFPDEVLPALAVGQAAELVKEKGETLTWPLTCETPEADLRLALHWTFNGR